METLVQIKIISETCCKCGVLFGLEESYQQRMVETGEEFSCPNGHRQHYTESCQSKMDKIKQDRDWYSNKWEEQIETSTNLEYSIRTYKGHITRLKNKLNHVNKKSH